MKNIFGQGPVFISPPPAMDRPNVMDQPSPTSSYSPPLFHYHQLKEHDKRVNLAAGERMQRIRARQMEPRTAVDCHVRTRRRSRLDG